MTYEEPMSETEKTVKILASTLSNNLGEPTLDQLAHPPGIQRLSGKCECGADLPDSLLGQMRQHRKDPLSQSANMQGQIGAMLKCTS